MKNSIGVLFVFLVSAHLCFSQNSFFGWMNGGRLTQDIEKQTAKSNISPLETNSLENVNFSTSQKQSDQPISENNPNFPKASSPAINNALLNTNISNGKTNLSTKFLCIPIVCNFYFFVQWRAEILAQLTLAY